MTDHGRRELWRGRSWERGGVQDLPYLVDCRRLEKLGEHGRSRSARRLRVQRPRGDTGRGRWGAHTGRSGRTGNSAPMPVSAASKLGRLFCDLASSTTNSAAAQQGTIGRRSVRLWVGYGAEVWAARNPLRQGQRQRKRGTTCRLFTKGLLADPGAPLDSRQHGRGGGGHY